MVYHTRAVQRRKRNSKSRWTELSADVFALVARHLTAQQLVQLCAVCKDWHTVCKDLHSPLNLVISESQVRHPTFQSWRQRAAMCSQQPARAQMTIMTRPLNSRSQGDKGADVHLQQASQPAGIARACSLLVYSQPRLKGPRNLTVLNKEKGVTGYLLVPRAAGEQYLPDCVPVDISGMVHAARQLGGTYKFCLLSCSTYEQRNFGNRVNPAGSQLTLQLGTDLDAMAGITVLSVVLGRFATAYIPEWPVIGHKAVKPWTWQLRAIIFSGADLTLTQLQLDAICDLPCLKILRRVRANISMGGTGVLDWSRASRMAKLHTLEVTLDQPDCSAGAWDQCIVPMGFHALEDLPLADVVVEIKSQDDAVVDAQFAALPVGQQWARLSIFHPKLPMASARVDRMVLANQIPLRFRQQALACGLHFSVNYTPIRPEYWL